MDCPSWVKILDGVVFDSRMCKSYFCTDKSLKSLIDNEQIPFSYLENPNGSKANIAGICSLNKRVLGLMQHTERVIFKENGGTDGFKFFNSIM